MTEKSKLPTRRTVLRVIAGGGSMTAVTSNLSGATPEARHRKDGNSVKFGNLSEDSRRIFKKSVQTDGYEIPIESLPQDLMQINSVKFGSTIYFIYKGKSTKSSSSIQPEKISEEQRDDKFGMIEAEELPTSAVSVFTRALAENSIHSETPLLPQFDHNRYVHVQSKEIAEPGIYDLSPTAIDRRFVSINSVKI